MSNTIATNLIKVASTTLNLQDIIWVEDKNKTTPTRLPAAPTDSSIPTSNLDRKKDVHIEWRYQMTSALGPEPNEPFPEVDSNGNPCRILLKDPLTNTWISDGVYHLVNYPDGHQRILPNKSSYTRHINAKICHFALAALAAWPEGEIRPFPSSWRTYNEGGNINAAIAISPTMWNRASVQGYLKPGDIKSLNAGDRRVRTNKPVNAHIKRSRKLKSSAWPFSEKTHWFNIMSGALQITHNNMSHVLGSGSNIGNKELTVIKKTFPVFATNADFKRARKFFENLSSKKNLGATRTEKDTEAAMNWDPFKSAFNNIKRGARSTYQSNQNLFSTPYALVKTSLMLGCVPKVNEDGSITDYQQITPKSIENLQTMQPVSKSVIGIWKGGCQWSSSNPVCTSIVYNSVNVDNLTHMYMLLLNEVRLLSNEDLLRWATCQGLTIHKLNFDSNFVQRCKYDVFGYKLTDTLDYTCIVWVSADKVD